VLRPQRGDRSRVVERLVRIESLELSPSCRAAELLLEPHGSAQAALAERDQVAGALCPERVVSNVVGMQSF
jgi:hypothetical protein